MGEYKQFPKRILPPEKKDGSYTQAIAEAIYYAGTSSGGTISDEISKKIKLNRRYGNGTQPIEKYKDHFALRRNNKTGEREGINHLDFSIVPFFPRLKNTTIELLTSKTNRTNVVFLDDLASEDRITKKLQMQTDIENKEFVGAINEKRGVKEPLPQDLPEDVKSLEMLEEIGGVKLERETALEMGIDYVLNYDLQWDKRAEIDILSDIIENGVAVVRDFVNPTTKMIDIRVVDIANVILDPDSNYDYEKSQYMGEIRQMTVLDVYNEVKATTKREITEEDLENLNIRTEDGSDDIYNSDWYDAPLDKNLRRFLPHRIDVLDFVYLSTDVITSPSKIGEKHRIKESKVKKKEIKSGKVRRDEKGFYKLVNVKEKKLEVQVWRRGKWVIDTDIVFDYGLAFDQVRDNKFKPVKPFHAVRLNTLSLLDTVKPNLNALQLDMIQLQNLKANMAGYGLAIDFDALSNIKMGGKDYQPKELVKLYKLGGTMFYKRKKSGNPLDQISGTPIQELEGGMGRAYSEIMQDIEYHIREIQRNSGLNDVALAQSPNPETTFGQSQLAMAGANNAIANIYRAYKTIKESVAYTIALRLQNIAAKSPESQYKEIIGDNLWASLASKDVAPIQRAGLKIVDNPSQEDIQMLYQNMAKLAPNTISSYDLFLIESMVAEGKPLKAISAILEAKIRKREEEQQQYAMQAQQQNDAKQQAMQDAKLQFEIAQIEAKFKADRVLQQEKIQGQKEVQAENDYREHELYGERTRDDNY
jgi:hypothetical protein